MKIQCPIGPDGRLLKNKISLVLPMGFKRFIHQKDRNLILFSGNILCRVLPRKKVTARRNSCILNVEWVAEGNPGESTIENVIVIKSVLVHSNGF